MQESLLEVVQLWGLTSHAVVVSVEEECPISHVVVVSVEEECPISAALMHSSSASRSEFDELLPPVLPFCFGDDFRTWHPCMSFVESTNQDLAAVKWAGSSNRQVLVSDWTVLVLFSSLRFSMNGTLKGHAHVISFSSISNFTRSIDLSSLFVSPGTDFIKLSDNEEVCILNDMKAAVVVGKLILLLKTAGASIDEAEEVEEIGAKIDDPDFKSSSLKS